MHIAEQYDFGFKLTTPPANADESGNRNMGGATGSGRAKNKADIVSRIMARIASGCECDNCKFNEMTLLEEIFDLRSRLNDLEIRVVQSGTDTVSKKHKVKKIKLIAAENFCVSVRSIDGPVRSHHVAAARFASMVVAKDLTHLADLQIEALFSRKHGMLDHAENWVKDRCETDRVFKSDFDAFKRKCEEALK